MPSTLVAKERETLKEKEREFWGADPDAQAFALAECLPGPSEGHAIDPARRRALAERLSGYIGLPVPSLERAELRVSGGTFANPLLADEGQTVGRLDSRYAGPSLDRLAKDAAYDPQSSALSSAYVCTYNDYARNDDVARFVRAPAVP